MAKLLLDLGDDLHERIKVLAAADDRSVSAQIRIMLQTACKPAKRATKAKQGARLPDDFKVTRAMADWARAECPHVDGRREAEKFENYWRAKAGAAATKVDWLRTWKNWFIREEEKWQNRHAPKESTTTQRVAQARQLADEYRRRGE